MIKDQRTIEIKASPDQVFKQLENDPFPTFRILDTRLFLFIRLALIDGIGTGLKMARSKSLLQTPNESPEIGSALGPFTLVEIKRPSRYFLALNSRFFNCRTGYSLNSIQNGTLLNLNILAENPRLGEKIWWFFIKPVHALLARKVLKTIQRRVELAAKKNL